MKAISLYVKDLLGFLALAFLEDDDGEETEGHAADDRYERPEDYGAGEAEKFGREDHLICRLGGDVHGRINREARRAFMATSAEYLGNRAHVKIAS